jgi:hypothetical protein
MDNTFRTMPPFGNAENIPPRKNRADCFAGTSHAHPSRSDGFETLHDSVIEISDDEKDEPVRKSVPTVRVAQVQTVEVIDLTDDDALPVSLPMSPSTLPHPPLSPSPLAFVGWRNNPIEISDDGDGNGVAGVSLPALRRLQTRLDGNLGTAYASDAPAAFAPAQTFDFNVPPPRRGPPMSPPGAGPTLRLEAASGLGAPVVPAPAVAHSQSAGTRTNPHIIHSPDDVVVCHQPRVNPSGTAPAGTLILFCDGSYQFPEGGAGVSYKVDGEWQGSY